MLKRLFYVVLITGIHHGSLVAQEATVVKDTTLHLSPSISAKSVINLEKNSPVRILKRKRAWYQVESDSGDHGWLKMISVRYVAKTESSGSRDHFTGLTATTTSIGVRGMSEEEMADSGGEGGLSQLDRQAATKEQAANHAQEGGLQSRSIDYQP